MMWFDKLFFAGLVLMGTGGIMSIVAFGALILHRHGWL